MAVRSEIDSIRQVVIHSPGIEHNFTLPKNTREWVADEHGKLIQNPDYLLFDDIISPGRMSNEHSELEQVLIAFTGSEKTYQFLINARTGELQGERPWSFIKIILIILAVLGIIALIIAVAALGDYYTNKP